MLGVPAEIVIGVAEPAEAWPDPVPPVVHAAIATPMTETAIARTAITAARFLLLFFNLENSHRSSPPRVRRQNGETRHEAQRPARAGEIHSLGDVGTSDRGEHPRKGGFQMADERLGFRPLRRLLKIRWPLDHAPEGV